MNVTAGLHVVFGKALQPLLRPGSAWLLVCSSVRCPKETHLRYVIRVLPGRCPGYLDDDRWRDPISGTTVCQASGNASDWMVSGNGVPTGFWR